MRERRYTLSEIDQMRAAILQAEESDSYHPHQYDFESFPASSFYIPHFPTVDYEARRKRAEELLRTYMIGGVDPRELEAKAKEAGIACKKRIEDYERVKIDRRLTKEYGPCIHT